MIETTHLPQTIATTGALSSFNAWHVVALLIGGMAMHLYHAVVNGGGYIMIWRRFKYGPTGKPVAPGTTAQTVPGYVAPHTSRPMAAPNVRSVPATALGRPAGSVSTAPVTHATAASAPASATKVESPVIKPVAATIVTTPETHPTPVTK